MEIRPGALLGNINNPDDLKKIPKDQLHQVCNELRQYIIDIVSVHGGHFAASLGVVELSVALHYIYNTPYDQLVWDVGHQAYGHKILTGRRDQFVTNRKYKGLSGFPKRSESEYDTFGVGHSSTSISAALGMAMAAKYKGENRKSIAVIGDGSMTAGMAFEAMNHAGVADSDVLIILNDNCMSIDPNVGALKEYLTDIATSPTYNKVRDEIWNLLGKMPVGKSTSRSLASKLEASVKGMVSKSSNLFEALQLRYFGPIDGHNITNLVDTLKDLRDIPGPKLLHVITTKGKGYELAEKDQTKWHAPGLFDKLTGEIIKKKIDTPQAPKYQDVFGHTLLELAKANPLIMGVTPAMPSGSSLKFMMDAMPDRAFDVGICEQHAVTLSAGLATQGMRVFCNIYSSFMQRAFDQVVHDVAIQKSPIEIGKGRKIKDGKDVAILSFGHPGNFATTAIRNLRSEGIDPAHYDIRFVKPLDEALLHEVFSNYTKIVTVEDGTVVGGFGSAILEFMNANGYKADVTILGIPDRLVEHGTLKELHSECAYDAAGIEAAVKQIVTKEALQTV